MKKLLALLGIHIHAWEKWENDGRPVAVAYAWTEPGCYAYMQQYQKRTCSECGITESRHYTVR